VGGSNMAKTADVAAVAAKIAANMEKVLAGKRGTLQLCLAAYFGGGHILLQDFSSGIRLVLAKALAWSVGCALPRIQCTPRTRPAPHPTHARPAAHRRARARAAPGPDLYPDAGGHRHRPRPTGRPGRVPGGDGRAARPRGRADLPPRTALPGARRPPPDGPR